MGRLTQGKTGLLQLLHHHVERTHSFSKVVYMSASEGNVDFEGDSFLQSQPWKDLLDAPPGQNHQMTLLQSTARP